MLRQRINSERLAGDYGPWEMGDLAKGHLPKMQKYAQVYSLPSSPRALSTCLREQKLMGAKGRGRGQEDPAGSTEGYI